MTKRQRWSADNPLGWTEEEFDFIKALLTQAAMSLNQRVHPQLLRDYCSMPDWVKYPELFPEHHSATEISASLNREFEDGSGKVCANTRLQIIKWG